MNLAASRIYYTIALVVAAIAESLSYLNNLGENYYSSICVSTGVAFSVALLNSKKYFALFAALIFSFIYFLNPEMPNELLAIKGLDYFVIFILTYRYKRLFIKSQLNEKFFEIILFTSLLFFCSFLIFYIFFAVDPLEAFKTFATYVLSDLNGIIVISVIFLVSGSSLFKNIQNQPGVFVFGMLGVGICSWLYLSFFDVNNALPIFTLAIININVFLANKFGRGTDLVSVLSIIVMSYHLPEAAKDFMFNLFIFLMLITNLLVNEIIQKKIFLNDLCESSSKEAAKLKKMQNQFLANVSHELRTPLTAIIGCTDIISDKISRNTKAQDLSYEVSAISKSSNYLLKIISSILEFTTDSIVKSDIVKNNFSIKKMFTESVTLMLPLAQKKNISLSLVISDGVPNLIESNEALVKQIISNLISNAIKFTSAGGVVVNVYFDSSGDDLRGKLRFSVEDTGIGIGQLHLEKIFSAFYQVESNMSRKYSGLGLGLAIVSKSVSKLNGKIDVTSSKDKGSRFEVQLPVVVLESVQRENKLVPQENLNTSKLKKKILVVDDSPDNVDVMAYFLDSFKFEIDIAVNGSEAITKVASNATEYDLILMDMQMPIMDGYQATKLLRQRGYKSPIMAVTAHIDDDNRKKCYEVGCDSYLSKPFNQDAFVAAVLTKLQDEV